MAQRSLSLVSPNGGEWFEPGETVQIRWTPGGTGWGSGDTVKLECSTDAGSSWDRVQGANRVAYNASYYAWTAPSSSQSSYYKIRVTLNGDSSVTDSSDSTFTVAIDSSAPTISHAPITYADNLSGPYRISANVTDNRGIASVTLFWSKNGGAYQSVGMIQSGTSDQYYADIPGPTNLGDEFSYYITARDTSSAANVSTCPQAAPADPLYFPVTTSATDTVGDTSGSFFYAITCGNAIRCTTSSRLTKIEQFFNITSQQWLTFVVYESPSLNGTYRKILEKGVQAGANGQAWYSSGPVSVRLAQGRYYIIGVASYGDFHRYERWDGHPAQLSFGETVQGYATGLPAPETAALFGSKALYYQRLSTAKEVRSIALDYPDGGEWIEPGETVRVRWNTSGGSWQPSDTVKLEYSMTSGTTWNAIPGAAIISHGAGAYDWNTSGYPTSSYYRVRVKAVVTDNRGVGSVLLFWSRNGSAFNQVPMTLTGTVNEYAADIPGPSRIGDRLCYYIEAGDTSAARNISRNPSGAPGTTNCFNITSCGVDSLAEASGGRISGYRYSFGNTFQCTATSRLTKIEHYVDARDATSIGFFVYESSSLDGTSQKVYGYDLLNPAAGFLWYGTPEINIPLVAGRYYIIGGCSNANAEFYYNTSGHPISTSFGQTVSGNVNWVYPPPGTTTRYVDSYVYRQRLSTCREPRTLTVFKPNGGECFDPGSTVKVQWNASGSNWESADTVKLEYSSNVGASWYPIPDASSIAYNADGFDWNTSGVTQSADYLVKVSYNGDSSVNDRSDAVFKMQQDTTAPVIVHTKLDSTSSTGPFAVTATVTDDLTGVGVVTLYYSKNGGAYASVPMASGTAANSYTAQIPSGAAGDRFCYYIVAADRSAVGNTAFEPAGAPGVAYCFDITTCATDVFDQNDWSGSGERIMSGNVFLCESSAVISKIEHGVYSASRLFIYESDAQNGPFTKLWEGYPNATSSYRWYASVPISVRLTKGKYYLIGAWWIGSSYAYAKNDAQPWAVNFGKSILGVYQSYEDLYNLPATFNVSGNYSGPDVFDQKITSCLISRDVIFKGPNGGQWYQLGDIVPVRWDTSGPGWKAGETVRVEYSPDGGSTWSAVPGGENVPYDPGAFDWNTTGMAESDNCRVRVVSTVDPSSLDASDASFVIRNDAVPPLITHTPLSDTGNMTGPYLISATVTDNYGLAGVTLFWSRNGGTYASASMTAVAGRPNEYSGEIPGPAKPGDVFCYYIEANDNQGNTAIIPSGAPDAPYCFTVAKCAVDELGGREISPHVSGFLEGNTFLCTVNSLLTGIEQYVNAYTGDDLFFVVYELDEPSSTYVNILDKMVDSPIYGDGWRSSGPVSVWLKQGKRYAIGMHRYGWITWFYQTTGVKPMTSLGWMEGRFEKNLGGSAGPPGSITGATIDPATACYQRLSSCREPLEILGPNGRNIFEAGQTVQITWRAAGLWEPDDTVKLEYSADAGANWNAITGAESLHYDLGSFDWNTSGLADSDKYLVRVVSNADASVNDQSDIVFSIFADYVAPVIVHTPLTDTDAPYSYEVIATVTDSYLGVGQVTLYWRQNGGTLHSGAMYLTADEYRGLISPATVNTGDVFEYYIVAKDRALVPNESRHPAEGFHSFTKLPVKDIFSEAFDSYKYRNVYDLDGTSVTFTPDGSFDFYEACSKPILDLPTDPAGGTQLTLADNGFAQVTLSGGKQVSIYGTNWGSFFVNSNGDITFDVGDTTFYPDLSYHFNKKRVSGYMTDLNPAAGGTVSWKQLEDRVAVTFENVLEKSTSYTNTFQMEMFFDGRIRLSYKKVLAKNGVTGISSGTGWPKYAPMSDLRSYPLCCTASVRVEDSIAPFEDNTMPFGLVIPENIKTGQVTVSNPSGCDLIVNSISPAMYAENFDDGLAQGWQLCDDSQWIVSSGELRLEQPAPSTSSFHVATYAGATFDKFYCEMKTKHLDLTGTAYQGQGYLIVRASPDFQMYPVKGSGYVFGIDNYYGGCSIQRQLNGSRTTIYTSTNPMINRSPTANTLAVDASGTRLKFYVNGTLVADVPEAAPLSGRVGVAGAISSPGKMAHTFDDLVVSPPLYYTGPVNGFDLNRLPTLPMMLAPGGSFTFDTRYASLGAGSSRAWVRISCLGGDRSTVDIDLTGTRSYAGSLSAAKSLMDGSAVAIDGMIVSAVFDGRFYIQDEGRTGGIGVIWDGNMPSVGDLVSVVGNLTTSGGERLIRGFAVDLGPNVGAPKPLALTNETLGGGGSSYDAVTGVGQCGIDGGSGLNNIGLLVRVFGKVTGSQDGCLYIDDGSNIDNVTSTGIRVVGGQSGYGPYDYLCVTGISSCFVDQNGKVTRRLLVRGAEDIVSVRTH